MRSSLRYFLVVFCVVVATAAFADGLRFTASPSVVQMRIEVLSSAGTLLFDSGWKEGNLLDWAVQDRFGHLLAYGPYRVRVLSKDLSGQSSEIEAMLRVDSAGVATDGQPNEPAKITLTAHDGEVGQLVTTSGDLSFRFGDFLNRKDVEVMRLTAQGDLDVVGLIHTGKGIVFPDGSIQRSAALPSIVRMRPSIPESDRKLNPKSDISGAGTTNQMTKWLDGPAGTVGDSVVTEVNGKVGIGTTNPGGNLHISGLATNDVFAGMGPDIINGPGFNYGYAGGSFGVGAGFFNVRPAAGATGVNPSLRFMTVDQQRMIITNAGNVGIGTSAPSQLLDVAGSVNASGNMSATGTVSGGTISGGTVSGTTVSGTTISGATGSFTGNITTSGGAISAGTNFNIQGQRVLSTAGSGNLFVGTSAGAANTTGQANTFVGSQAGSSNTTGGLNSFFGNGTGGALTTGFFNTMAGGLAGSATTTGGSNAFFGGQSGANDTTGSRNTAIGYNAGGSNTTENDNTFIGFASNGAAAITNATAIGANASVTQSDSLVLGATNVSVAIGTNTPKAKLDVAGGNVYLETAGKGVVLKSPDGLLCKLVTIDNAGAMVLTTITCP